MIEIDGSYGSGGGQILRTALGLAALTGKACKIYNIRMQRENPGLREQHLKGALALADLCNAETKGLVLGSNAVEFTPHEIKKENLKVNVTTAGSIGLVLQALMIPSLRYNMNIEIGGGATFGKHAPSVYYIKNVLSYFLKKMNYNYDIDVIREGFFPEGGSLVNFRSKAGNLKSLTIMEQGKIKSIEGISVAAKKLEQRKVAERQALEASKLLYNKFNINARIKLRYSDSIATGTGIQLWIETENSILGGSSFGELRKSAEDVAKGAVSELFMEYQSKAPIDGYAADQLLPYLAIGGGKIKVGEITEHARTNIFVIERFLPVKFSIKENIIEAGHS